MKRGRTLLVIALVLALLATAATQKLALSERRKLLKTTAGTSSTTSLANMDSFALALLLGGMRGPLVMFLWMQSETQKQAKDLEGVETQIEWIRLLQPEFDTVHLFQIWNKAYNISAQMASLANKYSVILDAIEYARNVERQRPDNLNILMSIANIFNDKLAGSSEKYYYRKRILEDTQYRPADRVERQAGARPTRYPSQLQPDGMIKPELLKPHLARPEGQQGEFYDGSELQFLKDHQPFPYGIPAYGMAYNYFKRSQVLQRTTGQRHLQISEMVIDSRPALCLRAWFEVEWDNGTRAEAKLAGQTLPVDRVDALAAEAAVDPLKLSSQIAADRADLDKALYHYTYSIKLADDADAAFRAHLAIPDYQMHIDMYRSHLEHLSACKVMITGDRAMLQAGTAQGEEKAKLIATARDAYKQAMREYRIIRLRYYSADEYQKDLYPAGMNRWNLETATDQQLEAFNRDVDQRNVRAGFDAFQDDAKEYLGYIKRAQDRMAMLPK